MRQATQSKLALISSQCPILLGSVLVTLLGFSARAAIAQEYSACQPPNAGEYLLLVLSRDEENQAQVQRLVPQNTTTTVCRYLDEVVVRVGSFTSAEVANSWAQYMSQIVGLQAVVARPSETASIQAPPIQTTPSSTETPPPATTTSPTVQATPSSTQATPTPAAPAPAAPTPATPAYNPQPLGVGYAVLVNYLNRPEVAADIQQLLATEIGLVSYGQSPYLLALHTNDVNAANTILRTLSDRNFLAMVVDSRQVVLLDSSVVALE